MEGVVRCTGEVNSSNKVVDCIGMCELLFCWYRYVFLPKSKHGPTINEITVHSLAMFHFISPSSFQPTIRRMMSPQFTIQVKENLLCFLVPAENQLFGFLTNLVLVEMLFKMRCRKQNKQVLCQWKMGIREGRPPPRPNVRFRNVTESVKYFVCLPHDGIHSKL